MRVAKDRRRLSRRRAAAGLRGLTVSAMWTLWNGTTATYATDCEVVSLD